MLNVNQLINDVNRGRNVNQIYADHKLKKLQKIKRHELQMIEERGYDIRSAQVYNVNSEQNKPGDDVAFVDIPDREEFEECISKLRSTSFTFQKFKQMVEQFGVFTTRPGFSTLYTHTKCPSDHLFVVYLDNVPERETGSKHFILFLDILVSQRYKNFIIITERGLTADKQKWIAQQTKDLSIEQFIDTDFITNPLRHAFAPLTTTVYPRGKASTVFLEDQGLENDFEKLPKMKCEDPQSKYRKLKAGAVINNTIVSILYDSETVASIRRRL